MLRTPALLFRGCARASSLLRPSLERGLRLGTRHDDSDSFLTSPFRRIDIPTTVSLDEYVTENWTSFGDSVALVNGLTGDSWNYARLSREVRSFASSLQKLGVKRGDVLALLSPNVPEFVVVYMAAISTGAVLSSLNPLYTPDELTGALTHSQCKLLIAFPTLAPTVAAARGNCPALRDVIMLPPGEVPGCRTYASMVENSDDPRPVKIDPLKDLVALPYSSGTTGLPKGVMLTHYNLLANVCQLGTEETLSYNQDEVLIGLVPFFHIYGQVVLMLTSLRHGSKIVTLPKFEPEVFLRTIQDSRATFLHVVPPLILFLANHPMVDEFDISSIHSFSSGAAPVSANAVVRMLDRLKNKNISFRQGYGLTEASPVTHCNLEKNFRIDTVGPAIHNVDFKIIDIENGKSLGEKVEGELCVRGPNIMKGYLNNEQATKECIDAEGWLHTGDIGFYELDNGVEHVKITDRLKELIKTKGFQVAPAELEAVLVSHPDIADAAVIGYPDERSGELPRAYIVAKANSNLTEGDVHSFVKGKVAVYKELNGGVIFRNEIPRSLTGKILRKDLKAELHEELKPTKS